MFGGSEKQHGFLTSLFNDRLHESGVTMAEYAEANVPGGVEAILSNVVDVKQASALIDELMRLQRKPAEPRPRPATDFPVPDVLPDWRANRPVDADVPLGIHFHEGRVYKVQKSRQSDGLYAKGLIAEEGNPDSAKWEYLGRSPLRFLAEETVMTREQAEAFGKRFGVCAICGRLLTQAESIERGIGPVCARRVS